MHFIIKTKEPPESDAVGARQIAVLLQAQAGVNISPLLPLSSLGEASEESPILKLELVERAGKS